LNGAVAPAGGSNVKSGGAIIMAAGVLGACIVGAAMLLSNSIQGVGVELAGVQGAATSIRYAIEQAGKNVPAPAAAAAAPQRRRGPDPARNYTVNTQGSPVKGPENAKITVVEFSDFQCPFCKRVTPTLEQVEKAYPGEVRVVFKHLPLSIHSKARGAHIASEAAHKQGKFWEMHDKLFENQRNLSEENYDKWAGELGLDVDQFKKDRAAAAITKRVDRDVSEAGALGVTGTPAFFINGKFLSGAQPFDAFKAKIDAELGA
jgi:protein-disulfide isomerase